MRALIALAIAAAVVAPAKAQTGDDFLAQPAEWVPLTYDFRDVRDGRTIYSYKVYRLVDGSERRDRTDGKEITIVNRALGRYFEFRSGRWTEHPMRPQVGDGNPVVRFARRDVQPVPATDARVRGLANVGVPLTFYEWYPSGIYPVGIICPELNMLTVWHRRIEGDGGVIERTVTSVQLGEPTVPLVPPAGAQVEISAVPAGPGSVSRL